MLPSGSVRFSDSISYFELWVCSIDKPLDIDQRTKLIGIFLDQFRDILEEFPTVSLIPRPPDKHIDAFGTFAFILLKDFFTDIKRFPASKLKFWRSVVCYAYVKETCPSNQAGSL